MDLLNEPSNAKPSGKLASFPCYLPEVDIPEDCDHESIATEFGQNLPCLELKHFKEDAVWRDVFALTGTLRTFYSPGTIIQAWKKTCENRGAHSISTTPKMSRIMRVPDGHSWITAVFEFETSKVPAAACSLILSLVPCDDGQWRIWVLGTVLEQFLDHPNCDVLQPSSKPAANGDASHGGESQFDCVVVGGGQAGLSVGGRLQALGVSYVILEKNENVGDNWKKRYDSAKLHITRQSAHLPFDRTFDASYPDFLTKNDLAKGYQDWADKFGINVWLSSSLISGSWQPETKLWKLSVKRGAQETTLTTPNLILALGAGGQIPYIPEIPGRADYKGTILHSAEYTSPPKEWKGKPGIVVGSANTAHDVAVDMVKAGLNPVTMIQRSKTYVMPYEYYVREIVDKVYIDAIPMEVADRMSNWNPLPVVRLMAMATTNAQAAKEPERFDALERAGFLTERYGDIATHLFEHFGGHYIDVGASAMIADGQIKVKPGVTISRYTEEGLEFSDGSVLEAEAILFATGFAKDTKEDVRSLLGEDVASQAESFWGIDKEGEIKGAFRPSGHPGLWMHGGSQGQARYFSRFLALQVKAAVEGTPLPVYTETPSSVMSEALSWVTAL